MDISKITTYQSGIVQAAAHRITTRVVSDFLQQYDLTAMHWFIIGHIYDHSDTGLRLTDLTKTLQATLPYTTTTVNFLESKGIVTKKVHATDSRTKLVSINPSYYQEIEKIESGLRDEMRNKLYDADNISRDELQTYITVLYKMANANSAKNPTNH